MTSRPHGLTEDEQGLFDRARESLRPSFEARDQVRARLRASVAASGVSSRPRLESIPRAKSGAASPLLVRRMSVVKLAFGVLGALTIAGAAGRWIPGWMAGHREVSLSAQDSFVTPDPERHADDSIVPAPTAQRPESAPLPPAAVPRPVSKLRSRTGSGHAARPVPESTPEISRVGNGPPNGESLSDRLAIEARLLERARADLREGELAQAEEILEEHRVRFPSGSLTEERESLRVESALRSRGPQAAQSLLDDFRSRYPRSFFLPALESELSGSQH